MKYELKISDPKQKKVWTTLLRFWRKLAEDSKRNDNRSYWGLAKQRELVAAFIDVEAICERSCEIGMPDIELIRTTYEKWKTRALACESSYKILSEVYNSDELDSAELSKETSAFVLNRFDVILKLLTDWQTDKQ